jgi:hypothetical protein
VFGTIIGQLEEKNGGCKMKIHKKSFMFVLAASILFFTGCSKEKEKDETIPAPAEENADQSKDETNEEAKKNPGIEFIIKAKPQTIEHVHGIGYPGNDEGLYVATHHGIKIFTEGSWYETQGENHDYMGFQAVEDGFYASGHPEEGSSLKNPLGLVKSTNYGESLEKTAFYGESDFHFMAASYKGGALYLINEQSNSKLEAGVYVSKGKSNSWEPLALKGMESNTLGMIAVHPEKGGTFAMSTKDGVFVSEDYGKTIQEIGEYEMVTTAAFSKDSLYISPIQEKNLKLVKLILGQEGRAVELSIPTLKYDNPITYIAADYKQEGRLAFITIQNDLYESTDGGQTWKQLLSKGKVQ